LTLIKSQHGDAGAPDYRLLAEFRYDLRCFLRFSEEAARKAGLTPQRYQALLSIKGSPAEAQTIGELADRLLIEPHSASSAKICSRVRPILTTHAGSC